MRELTFGEAIREALYEEMERDKDVIVMGEDIGEYGGLQGVTTGLLERFGIDRVLETPISECAVIGAATGAALKGFRPVIEIGIADILSVAMDQIVNSAAKMRYFYCGQSSVPLVIRAISGERGGGGPQHSQCPEAWFVHVPGLKVVMPSTPRDAKGLMKASIRDNDPVIFFEQKSLFHMCGPVPEGEFFIPLGQAEIKRSGTDITLIATGLMVGKSLLAAEKLQRDNINIEVLDPLTLKPLDKKAIIESIKKTGRALIVHEAHKTGGWGGEVAALIVEEAYDYLKAPILRLGALDVPIPCSPPMINLIIPDEEKIIEGAKRLYTYKH